MRFITSSYGNKYLPMIWTNLFSIEEHHNKDSVSILYDDISPYEINILKSYFTNYDFIQMHSLISEKHIAQKISLKLRFWLKACDLYPNELICFLDIDTVLCSNISKFLEKDFDIIYTWKNEKFALNTGIIILKNKSNTRQFMKYWLKFIEIVIANPKKLQYAIELEGAADQFTLSKILNTKHYSGFIERKVDNENIKFLGIECKNLNETNCRHISDETYIIHYKAGWHPILLENKSFTKFRPKEKCWEMYNYWQKIYKGAMNNSLKKYLLYCLKKYKADFTAINNKNNINLFFKNKVYLVNCLIKDLKIEYIIEIQNLYVENSEFSIDSFVNGKRKIIHVILKKNEEEERIFNDETSLKRSDRVNYEYLYEILNKFRKKNIALIFNCFLEEKHLIFFKGLISQFPTIILCFFNRIENVQIHLFDYFNRFLFISNVQLLEILKALEFNHFLINEKDLNENLMAIILPLWKDRLKVKFDKDFGKKLKRLYRSFNDKLNSILKKITGNHNYNSLVRKFQSIKNKLI